MIPLNIHNFLDMEVPMRKLEESQSEAVVFLGKVGIGITKQNLQRGCFDSYDGIFLILDDVDNFNGKTEAVSETVCVTVRFHGSHTESPKYYEKLLSHIAEHKLEITGFSREITMIDYGITDDTNKFVTEISIPINCK